MINTIQAEWNKFKTDAISEEATPSQVGDARLAFYAGAWSMMGMQHRLVEEGHSEEAGVAIMSGIYEEMVAFFEDAKHTG
jgi:hypothetical protein